MANIQQDNRDLNEEDDSVYLALFAKRENKQHSFRGAAWAKCDNLTSDPDFGAAFESRIRDYSGEF